MLQSTTHGAPWRDGSRRRAHEWWRDTLPTVPVTRDWNAVIACLEQVDRGVSLAVLDGTPRRAVHLPAPGATVFGIQVWLTVGAEVQVDQASVCLPLVGDVVLFSYAAETASRTRIPGGRPVSMVDIRFSEAALALRGAQALCKMLQEHCAASLSRPDKGAFVACMPAPPALIALARTMAACPQNGSLARRLWWQARALEALSVTAELLNSAAPQSVMGDAHQAALRAERVLLQRFGEDWTAARLARMLHMSEKRLQHAFREIVGMTISARLRAIRLDVAASMLADGRRVTDVAADVGYASLSHFSQSFRAQFGRSPQQWRGPEQGAIAG